MKKSKILCLAQLPPPVHGASMMNKYIKDSEKINAAFNICFLPLSFADKLDDIGKRSFKKFFKMIVFCFKLITAIIKKKPDLVYFTIAPFGGAFYRDALFVFIIKLFRKKIVFHLHGKGIKENCKKSHINKLLYKVIFNNTRMIILSNRLNKDIEEVYSKKPIVLNNGIIDLKIKRTSISNSPIVFIYLSNLVLSKGIKVFLDAIILTKIKGYDFRVKIVGNSADYSVNEVRNFVKQNDLEKYVTVLGPKYNDEKFKELSCSDVFVFPTQNDCFPLSILEAMQMQLPVISTRQGAIPDIIEDNINGIIVREGNVKDVSEAMISYIENMSLIIKHGQCNLLKFRQNFSKDIFEENFIKIINSVLNEKI